MSSCPDSSYRATRRDEVLPEPVRRFSQDGFVLVSDIFDADECERLAAACRSLGEPGSRTFLGQDWCAALASALRSHSLLRALIPAEHVAVQCTYFEKSTSTNWLVPIHQDLSIPVAEKVEHAELSGWSLKDGSLYVQPPVSLLRQLVAIRLHLDACGEDDGPLCVVPGSHAAGRIELTKVALLRDASGTVNCVAPLGSALILRPLLLHSSSKASGNSQRRVLHFLYGPASLPCGLRWQHAV